MPNTQKPSISSGIQSPELVGDDLSSKGKVDSSASETSSVQRLPELIASGSTHHAMEDTLSSETPSESNLSLDTPSVRSRGSTTSPQGLKCKECGKVDATGDEYISLKDDQKPVLILCSTCWRKSSYFAHHEQLRKDHQQRIKQEAGNLEEPETDLQIVQADFQVKRASFKEKKFAVVAKRPPKKVVEEKTTEMHLNSNTSTYLKFIILLSFLLTAVLCGFIYMVIMCFRKGDKKE